MMRYCAREVEQADRESKKAGFVALANTEEELPRKRGGVSSSSTLWKPLGERSGEAELGGTMPQKIMNEVPRERSRSQKREHDGDEAEDDRPGRYQAVQEDSKDIVMEEVKSLNKVPFEMNQKVRDERMNRLLKNSPSTDELWNVNAKKGDGRSGPVRGEVEAQNSSSRPNSRSQVRAATRLVQVQQQSDRDFQFMECTSSKSDGQGQECEAGGVQQLLWNRTSSSGTHEQWCSEGQTPSVYRATDVDASSRRCAQRDWRSE